jgi:hypothetical protein
MRVTWITIGMSDSSAFNLTLASASVALAQESNPAARETIESMKYYTTSIRALKQRLQDPVDSTSDGVISTILGFACLDVSYSMPAKGSQSLHNCRMLSAIGIDGRCI